MNNIDFKLKDQEHIELHKLLKHLNLVSSGGEAKVKIRSEQVKVNGEIETRRRKKLISGTEVLFENHVIKIN